MDTAQETYDTNLKELNRRNTVTVEAAMKDLYAQLYFKQTQLDQVNAGLASLQERMNNLEQQLIIQKVQLTGLGPSVRE